LSQLELELPLVVAADLPTAVQRPSAMPAHTPCADWSASKALASAQLAAEPIGHNESLHRHSKSMTLPAIR
jgi:hypothetical protein